MLGYTGLSAAKTLVENGYDVTVFETTEDVAGVAKCIPCGDTYIEKHYRHIFKSDSCALKLLNEFGLEDKMQWNETMMAYYSKEGLYGFGTPLTLLTYRPLNLWQKFLFGLSYLKVKLNKDYKSLENQTEEEWIKKNCGEKIYKKIWEPLLITKFGSQKSQISMAWLWGKINLRSSSGTLKGERLGYLTGSYKVFNDALKKCIEEKGCKIKLNSPVNKVTKQKSKFIVETPAGEEKDFDYVINTVAYEESSKFLKDLLKKDEIKKMGQLKYTSARTMLLKLKKSFSKFYWMNIGDNDIPFGGVIEHTNMINKETYGGDIILYISNYMFSNDKLYNKTKEELLDVYIPFLQRINPEFKKEDIIEYEVYDEKYAQPVITTGYSDKKLDIKLKEKNLYMATMAQIYPEDRGMNYALELGEKVAKDIIGE